MFILVDMDGVVADFEKGFLEQWKKIHPDKQGIPLEQRTTFYPRDQYPTKLAEDIVLTQGFYRYLPSIDGSINALKQLEKRHDIFICTSPRNRSKYCVSEKYEWIEQNLGREWIPRTILSKDKTLIYGDFLIDDKESIKGCIEKPRWQHILYKQPYNTGSFTWNDYKRFL